jgi:hypothetical protein
MALATARAELANKEKMMRAIRYLLLTGVLAGVLSTCDMTPVLETDKPAGEGKVRVSIQIGYPGAERSVFPQVVLEDIDHYALWGAPAGTEETALLPSFTQDTSVVITEGVWNFTVTGYKAEDLVLQGKLTDQTISLESHSLTFSLEPLLEGVGSIAITLILPSGSGVTTAAVFKDGVEQQSPVLSLTGEQLAYSAADVAAGDYYYSFRLKDSAANTIAVVSEVVLVRARLSSEKTITLTQVNLNALPDTPAAPVLEAGDGQLVVSWAAVPMVGDYEVYYSDTSTPPDAPAKTVSNMTTTVISGLTNGATYYVWVKAKNSGGTSGLSPAASGTPGWSTAIAVTLTPPDEWDVLAQTATVEQNTTAQFTVTETYAAYHWYLDGASVGTAASYTFDADGKTADDVFELVVVVSDEAGEQRSGRVRITVVAPGNTVALNAATPELFAQALTDIQDSAEAAFTVTVGADMSLAPQTLSGAGYSGKTITLKGDGSERAISLSSQGSLFTVGEDVTLVLDSNITLQGKSDNNAPLVKVNNGGELTILSGSTITGNISTASGDNNGGGVYVNTGGSATLDGGSISNNTVSSPNRGANGGGVYITGGTFTMISGTISGNKALNTGGAYSAGGAGVMVDGGIFVMEGGIIEGNTASCTGYNTGGGVAVWHSSSFTMSGGSITNNTIASTSSSWADQVRGGGLSCGNDYTFNEMGGSITGNWKQIAGGTPTSDDIYLSE